MNELANFFWQIAVWLGAERYSQHAICLTNDPFMIVLYVGSDLLIWFSYAVIGIALISSRMNVVAISPGTRLLYGLFIFFCGATHFTSTLTVFWGIYRLDVIVNSITAAVSLVTAAMTTKEVMGKAEKA